MSKAPRGMVSGQSHDLIAQYEEPIHLRAQYEELIRLRAELASLLNRSKISPQVRMRGGTYSNRSVALRRLRTRPSASRTAIIPSLPRR